MINISSVTGDDAHKLAERTSPPPTDLGPVSGLKTPATSPSTPPDQPDELFHENESGQLGTENKSLNSKAGSHELKRAELGQSQQFAKYFFGI